MRTAEKHVLLTVLDKQWKDHLLSLDHLRQAVGLRAYAQRDPLNEYKREAFELFEEMLAQVREETISLLARIEIRPQTAIEQLTPQRPSTQMVEGRQDPALAGMAPAGEHEMAMAGGQQARGSTAVAEAARPVAGAQPDPNDPATWGKVQRNAPCPCGSGKKFKHCHGKIS